MSFLPKFRLTSVATGAATNLGSPARVVKVVLFGGSANSQVELKNAATDTGTVMLSVNALTATTRPVELLDVGGIPFSTDCYVKPAGTAAIAYIWWEPLQTQASFQ